MHKALRWEFTYWPLTRGSAHTSWLDKCRSFPHAFFLPIFFITLSIRLVRAGELLTGKAILIFQSYCQCNHVVVSICIPGDCQGVAPARTAEALSFNETAKQQHAKVQCPDLTLAPVGNFLIPPFFWGLENPDVDWELSQELCENQLPEETVRASQEQLAAWSWVSRGNLGIRLCRTQNVW